MRSESRHPGRKGIDNEKLLLFSYGEITIIKGVMVRFALRQGGSGDDVPFFDIR